MPELPEVETIRRALAPKLDGATIESLTVIDAKLVQHDTPEYVSELLRDARIERLARSGKYLIWELEAGRRLLLHLRMTGTLLYDPVGSPPYVRARFDFSDGHALAFSDPRRFGTLQLFEDSDQTAAYLAARLGAEPLTPAFTPDYLIARARGRNTPIKSFLLDQHQIAGIGNIYADEALFRAKIHPLRPAGALTPKQWRTLKETVEAALQAGIDAKGASIDDFRHPDGARGSFQDTFLVHTRVGLPCPTCGHEIEKLYVGGRGTYVCPRCQPRPRLRPRAATTMAKTSSRSSVKAPASSRANRA